MIKRKECLKVDALSWISPDPFLELLHVDPAPEKVILIVQSTRLSSHCPFCACLSIRSHSRYSPKIQDEFFNHLPVELLVLSRKWFCCDRQVEFSSFRKLSQVLTTVWGKTPSFNV